MSYENEVSASDFLDMTMRQVSDLLCKELTAKIEEGMVPLAGASLLGTNPCDGSRVKLTVTLRSVEDDE